MFGIVLGNHNYKLKIEHIFYVLLTIIIFSSGTVWGYLYRYNYIIALGVVALVKVIMVERKADMRPISYYFLFLLILLYLNSRFSYSSNRSMIYFKIYLCIFAFLVSGIKEDFWNGFLKIMDVLSIVFAISIIASAINPTLFYGIFGPLISGGNTKYLDRVRAGQFAGFAYEIADAAILMNYGIAIQWSRWLSGDKSRNRVIAMIILYAGLLLTTKRTLLVIALGLPLLFFLLQKQDLTKRVKAVIAIVAVSIVALVVVLNVPALSTVIGRFQELENNDNMGGRAVLWASSIMMFMESPMVGMGYGSFNSYFNDNLGQIVFPTGWSAHGHNVYLQALGEIGIVGVVLLFVPVFIVAIKGLIAYRKIVDDNKRKLIFWLYILLMFLLYGYTGNCLYLPHQICMLVFAIYRVNQMWERRNGNG